MKYIKLSFFKIDHFYRVFYHFFSELNDKTSQKDLYICGKGKKSINGSCVPTCQQDRYKCLYGKCYAHLNGTATCMYGSILSSIFYYLMLNYKFYVPFIQNEIFIITIFFVHVSLNSKRYSVTSGYLIL